MKLDNFLKNKDIVVRKIIGSEGVRLKKVPACYVIENKITGNIYIGSTRNISGRVNHHKFYLSVGMHSNSNLQKEYDNCLFKSNIIIHVLFLASIEEARDMEQALLDEEFNSGNVMNISNNARYQSGYDRTKIIAKLVEFNRLPQVKEALSIRTKELWASEEGRKMFIKAIGQNVVVDGIEYGSVREASRQTGTSIESIRRRLVNNVCSLNDIRPKQKRVSCEGVIYPSVSKAAEVYGIMDNTMTYRLQNTSNAWKDFIYLD